MTSDQSAQIEQLESHCQTVRTDLEAAMSKQRSIHLAYALQSLDDMVHEAKLGILEQ